MHACISPFSHKLSQHMLVRVHGRGPLNLDLRGFEIFRGGEGVCSLPASPKLSTGSLSGRGRGGRW